MRRLLAALGAATCTLLAVPAHAADEGRIDHVEVAEDGGVKLLFSLPDGAEASSSVLGGLRVSVAGEPVDAEASTVSSGDVRRTAVLALDVSKSMRGARFQAAQQAALAFLDAAPEDVSVGLVTFAGSVSAVRSPTTDHDAVEEAVNGLQLSPGTQLYDGIASAVSQVGGDGHRQVVVLSDGADTGSTPLDQVVSAAEKSGVIVDVVALEQSAANQEKLRLVTDATGGSVLPADDPAALTALFAREAEALAQQVLVTFDSPHSGDTTIDVSVPANGQTYGDSTFVTLTASTPEQAAAAGPVPVERPGLLLDERFLFLGVGALGVGLAVVTGALLLGKPKSGEDLVQRQLQYYTARGDIGGGGSAPSVVLAKPQLDIRGSAVAVADQIVKGGGFEERISQRLTAAGMSLTAAEWLLLHAGVVVVSTAVGLLLSGGGLLMAGLALLGGALGPYLFLSLKESRRLKAFNSQLADTLQLMSGGLSAGLSLPQAVDTVVREGAEPMAGELRRALVEQRLGVDIEDALDGVAERMRSKDFSWVVMAIRIQREIGGNLAELLNTVAATIREREYLRRQVRTLSAEGRLSAWILGGLPVVFAMYLTMTQPGYLVPMYTTSLGLMLSVGAVVLLGLGTLWLKSVVKVEV
jgi:tight adherence protein B